MVLLNKHVDILCQGEIYRYNLFDINIYILMCKLLGLGSGLRVRMVLIISI